MSGSKGQEAEQVMDQLVVMARREDPWRYWVDYNHLCVADPQIPCRPFRLVVPADAYDKLLKKYEALKKKRKQKGRA